MSNIFTKPKNASYINQPNTSAKNVEAKDNLYVDSFHYDSKDTLRDDDNNIFTKSKEALYINSYQGGRTDTATVTISKDNIIYVDIDNEYIYLESYLENHIYYC